MTRAVLNVDGADCLSCRYAIEHAGWKIAGVHAIEMHPHEIQIGSDGNRDALYRIIEIVGKLGYNASIEEAGSANQ